MSEDFAVDEERGSCLIIRHAFGCDDHIRVIYKAFIHHLFFDELRVCMVNIELDRMPQPSVSVHGLNDHGACFLVEDFLNGVFTIDGTHI